MRSVRLNEALEARLQEASRLSGQPVSAIIRGAVEAECNRILGRRADIAWADVIGAVRGRRSRAAADTGRAFLASLKRKRKAGEL